MRCTSSLKFGPALIYFGFRWHDVKTLYSTKSINNAAPTNCQLYRHQVLAIRVVGVTCIIGLVLPACVVDNQGIPAEGVSTITVLVEQFSIFLPNDGGIGDAGHNAWENRITTLRQPDSIVFWLHYLGRSCKPSGALSSSKTYILPTF